MTFRIGPSAMAVLLALCITSCGGGESGSGAAVTGAGLVGSQDFSATRGAGGAATGSGDAAGAGIGSSAAGGATGDATAAAGDDGSGVGSGGTGVSATAGVGIGSADGLGSVIVNGIRYNTDAALLRIDDASELRLGMSLKVTGTVSSSLKTGTAAQVESAAELRGVIASVDLAGGTFTMLGTNVSTDPETVWADTNGLSGLRAGSTVQVWGLPAAPGTLRATRVVQVPVGAAPIATGTVQNLNALTRVFSLGALRISYAAAALTGGLDTTALADGMLVRVRGDGWDGASTLPATIVQAWYPVPQSQGLRVDLDGLITDYAGLATFRVLGTPVDATGAQVTGGQSTNIGNGVKVEVAGLLDNGILRATKLKIRHIPGTGGPSSFTLIGPVGAYTGPASFRVRGQPVDASSPGVTFVNGNAGTLRNGAAVTVAGSQVRAGVLLADTVTFD